MDGIDKVYCNVAIRAALGANSLLGEYTVEELLIPARIYGKDDTLSLDAIPEIEISQQVWEFDPNIILFTEEIGQERKSEIPQDIALQPVVFVSDPMDGSDILKKFLEKLEEPQKKLKFKELISRAEIIEKWGNHADKTAVLSGTVCGISGVKKGVPFVSVIVNYITQYLFVSCELGNKMLRISDIPPAAFKSITLEEVFREGEDILFNFERTWDDFDNYRRFVTYLGKSVYEENLENARIFISNPETYSIEGIPWGPSRILYLSSLYKENPVGFIMANGEKITEWIHWLPYIGGASQREEFPLQIFEIFFERPWTRNGILMATSPDYSIFVPDIEKDRHLIDLAKIKDYANPSRYRSTFLITFRGNEWVLNTMRRHEYRELKL